jgi:hypothetical protein
MKLMGMPNLRNFIASRAGEAGAAAALYAELEAAVWKCAEDVAIQYPNAVIDGRSIRIPLDEAHSVDLVANYDAGVILIEFAGLVRSATGDGRSSERKAG